MEMQEHKFEILVDDVPYIVKVTPFDYNTETRFKVSYNGGPEHIFTWNSDLKRLWAIDDSSSTMPDDLEVAIANKIESGNY